MGKQPRAKAKARRSAWPTSPSRTAGRRPATGEGRARRRCWAKAIVSSERSGSAGLPGRRGAGAVLRTSASTRTAGGGRSKPAEPAERHAANGDRTQSGCVRLTRRRAGTKRSGTAIVAVGATKRERAVREKWRDGQATKSQSQKLESCAAWPTSPSRATGRRPTRRGKPGGAEPAKRRGTAIAAPALPLPNLGRAWAASCVRRRWRTRLRREPVRCGTVGDRGKVASGVRCAGCSGARHAGPVTSARRAASCDQPSRGRKPQGWRGGALRDGGSYSARWGSVGVEGKGTTWLGDWRGRV